MLSPHLELKLYPFFVNTGTFFHKASNVVVTPLNGNVSKHKSILLYVFKCNKKLNLKLKEFEGAEYYFKNFISLPIYVNLKKTEIKKICKIILNFYNN